MQSNSKWTWFYEMVQAEIEPIMGLFGFQRMTGKGTEEDENKNRMTVVFYKNPVTEKIATVDLRQYSDTDSKPYYLLRLDVTGTTLKFFLYPAIREDTKDPRIWDSWKCYQDEVQTTLKQMADGLKKYFEETSGNTLSS